MKVFGLTGGIGMGKSAAESILRNWGLPVVDTDALARQIVEPGQPALAEIAAAFGNDCLSGDGQLNRGALAHLVFADPAARQKLEAITHPRIRSLWRRQIVEWRAADCQVAVVVIPLLFETGAEKELDFTICVACSVVTQERRLLERGWTREQIGRRIAAQWPVEKKLAQANYAIWSEGGLEVLAAQLSRVFGVGK